MNDTLTCPIHSFETLGAVDGPGIRFVIFTQGCLLKCKYCQNRDTWARRGGKSYTVEELINKIDRYRNYIIPSGGGITVSGGEPLFQEALLPAIADVKQLGFKVGLHTAGAYPDRFAMVVPFIDWVGFDVKQAFGDYQLITNIPGSGEKALESLKILLASNVDYEVRMTLHESIEKETVVEVLRDLCQMGVRKMVLQKCRDKDENVVEHPVFSDKILLENVSKDFDSFYVRG